MDDLGKMLSELKSYEDRANLAQAFEQSGLIGNAIAAWESAVILAIDDEKLRDAGVERIRHLQRLLN